MLQYLLLIYAFANLHDFSWGTKSQDENQIDLGITKKVNNTEVEVALPSDQTDIGSSLLLFLLLELS
jgi:chitin synthase